MLHKIFKSTTLSISLILLASAAACNLPGAETDLGESLVDVRQEEDSLQIGQPFDQASPSEFFQICEDGGGQVEQWGDGWACDFEAGEDITCNSGGDCVFGTVEEPNAPGYTVKSPVLAAEDDPGDFVAACQDAGGAFIEWHAGFGCDFEENVDVFCGPEDGECGLGWVVELTTLVHVQEAVETPEESGRNLVMVAPLFQPAFVTEAESGIQADGAQGTFAVSKEVILDDFQQDNPQTDSDGNAVAQDKTGDDNFAGLSVDADNCELTGGSATIEIDPSDPSGNSDVMVCTFPDGGGYACTTSACSPFFEEQPDGSIDFGNFQDAFVATEVFIVLAGPSNLAPDLLGLDENWNSLYTSLVDMNGIVAPNNVTSFRNLPGTISVIGPNNVVFQDDGPGGMLLRPNTDGDPLLEKTCGILMPPLCWPEVGLLIPETNLVYYVEVADLPMPDKFNWVAELVATPTTVLPTAPVEIDPVTGEENANCRSGPGTMYSFIGFLAAGDSATVLGQNADGDWVFVRLENELECWVWDGALTEDSDYSDADILPDPPTPVVVIVTEPATTTPPTSAPPDPMNSSISGTVFKDGNGDGVMNGSDISLSSATVRLGSDSCSSTGLGSVVTGVNGSFSFSNLAAGTYCLSVDTSGSGSYSDITTVSQFTIVLGSGDSVSKKFGFQKVID